MSNVQRYCAAAVRLQLGVSALAPVPTLALNCEASRSSLSETVNWTVSGGPAEAGLRYGPAVSRVTALIAGALLSTVKVPAEMSVVFPAASRSRSEIEAGPSGSLSE